MRAVRSPTERIPRRKIHHKRGRQGDGATRGREQRLLNYGVQIRPFISYASEDRHVATRLRDDLLLLGATPWLDVIDLRAGEDWKVAIEQALRGSSHVIVLLSNQSVSKRGYVQREVARALELLAEFPPNTIFVIPVRLRVSPRRAGSGIDRTSCVAHTASPSRGAKRLRTEGCIITRASADAPNDGSRHFVHALRCLSGEKTCSQGDLDR